MRDQEFIGLYGAYHQICESSVIFEDEMEGNPLLSLTYDRRAKRLKDKAEKIRRKGGKTRTEETDLFDTILEHLVAEGYADTNESALVIMANMSEEWRQSIVEKSDDTYLETNFKKRKKNNEKALKDMKDNSNSKEYLNMVRKKFD